VSASFDCSTARKPTEREICRTPALSRLDDELASAYREALAVTHSPARMADEQLWWLRGRDGDIPDGGGPASGEGLRNEYVERLKVLRAEIARGKAARQPFPRRDLGRRCAAMGRVGPNAECGVARSGRVAGSGAGGAPELLFQTEQCCTDEGPFGGLVVFASEGAQALRPVLWAYEYGEWSAPRLVRSPAGLLLVAERRDLDAEDQAYASQVAFRQKDGRWRDINDMHLWRALQQHPALGDGIADSDGFVLDFAAMRGRARLLPDENGRSPGDIRFGFALEGDRWVLKGVEPVRRR
jgi:hypothetical protein